MVINFEGVTMNIKEKIWKGIQNTSVIVASIAMFGITVEAGNVSLDLEGCRADSANGYHGRTVPSVMGSPDLKMYFCNDSAYTDGNMKQWAELDMVPHRIIFSNTTGSDQNFTFMVGGDYHDTTDPTITGWDFITELTLDDETTPPEFLEQCAQIGSVATQTIKYTEEDGFKQIYREVDVKDYPDGVICVAIYNMRLALGSSGYPGSSLQSRLLPAPTGINVGAETLPVSDILSTGVHKTMDAATEGSYSWTISKNPLRHQFFC